MHAHSCKYRLDLRNSCTRVPAIRSSPAQRQALPCVCVHIASVSPAICVSGCGYVPGGRWTALAHFSTGGIHHRRQRPLTKGAPHDHKVTVSACFQPPNRMDDSSHVCGHVHASVKMGVPGHVHASYRDYGYAHMGMHMHACACLFFVSAIFQPTR